MSANDYFKNDEYQAKHINEDLWIEKYKTFLNSTGNAQIQALEQDNIQNNLLSIGMM